MQRKTWLYFVLVVAIAAAVGIGLYYYNQDKENEIDMTAVAATVDDVDVLEADITYFMATLRVDSATGEPMDDVAWAKLLKKSDHTPESLREYIIRNQFAVPILILKDAEALGLEPADDIIDAQIAEQREAIGDDKAWATFLQNMGFADEAAYRRLLLAQEMVTPLMEAKYTSNEPTQAEIDEFLESNAPYVTGKRSSAVVILISAETPVEDAVLAGQTALALLEDGEDFATVSDQLTSPGLPVEPGGDMGWEALTSLPDEYYEALALLEVGEVSDVVQTEQYVFVIMCTDEYNLDDGKFDPEAMPSELKEQIIAALPDYLESERPNKYFEALLESDRIVINPMPEGLPYDVDMALADPDLSKLVITDDVLGTGPEAKEGDLVRVTYIGYLEDGTIFDASENHEGYYEFTLGAGNVIEGWDYGLLGMKVGGKRTLVIPPELAYGEGGSGTIPPNATLTFEIELLAVNGDFGVANNGDKTADLPFLAPFVWQKPLSATLISTGKH
ncbi:MAG: FKBP-type peptidyl-prolyl cis-trans isomerase [Coriobacteriales bacterium]|jgi:hypothetical protein|nr:FKBP-type peptidyl-prolyl cis-trans isomerase [Coriobacteriales bacterium]